MSISDSIDCVHGLLLDLLSPIASVSQHHFDTVMQSDGPRLLKLARQHRILPMLHWQIGETHKHLELPDELRKVLKTAFEQSTIRSLQLKRELHLVNRLFKEAGIPCIFLKGAFLAWEAYPHPALRPMRDLDVLVPFDRAKEAWQVLVNAGFNGAKSTLHDMLNEDIEESHHHFPPLQHPDRKIAIELHYCLFPEDDRFQRNGKDLGWSADFWSRTDQRNYSGESVIFESPTDLVFHLVIHSVNHHFFDNGPLILSDVGFMLQKSVVDWGLFWELAKHYRVEKSCVLVLKLVQQHWGVKGISLPEEILHNVPVNMAARLMLIEHDDNSPTIIARLTSNATIIQKVYLAFQAFFPSKNAISHRYSVRKNSIFLYFLYLVNAYRLIVTRLYPAMKFNRSSESAEIVDSIKSLSVWLKK